MEFTLHRVLRTPHSERFMLQGASGDLGALEVHYLPEERVDATLVLFEGAGLAESDVEEVLRKIDHQMLPYVAAKEGKVAFTVVVGRVLGAFVPKEEA